jgi:hypothetical protein
MVIPGDDDIDLFLENSSGAIIAASTNGGADELVELTLPADDTYTRVVHGRSVTNEPLPDTLNFWAVPLASGGSLSVDAAPASATAGASVSVDISWSGLSPGTHLGAVSHAGDSGLLDLTLVEVENPRSATGAKMPRARSGALFYSQVFPNGSGPPSSRGITGSAQ